MTPPPFVILAAPRSRTAWLSAFLTVKPWYCGHEELRHCRTIEDLKTWLSQPLTGTAETAGAPHWRLLLKLCPNVRLVLVRRDPEDSVKSFMRLPGPAWDYDAMRKTFAHINRKLDQIERRVPGALSVHFDQLNDPAVMATLYRHCTGLEMDLERFQRMNRMNIQCNMDHIVRYTTVNYDQLVKLEHAAKIAQISHMSRKRRAHRDDYVIQQEPWDVAYRDCIKTGLGGRHALSSQSNPDRGTEELDADLHQKLYDIGALQVTTARCNGRPVGYLLTIIGPNPGRKGETTAIHNGIYADPDFPGVGRAMTLSARNALRERGVDEIIYRAGVSGDGPRIAALYKRVGAEEYGQLFRESLQR